MPPLSETSFLNNLSLSLTDEPSPHHTPPGGSNAPVKSTACLQTVICVNRINSVGWRGFVDKAGQEVERTGKDGQGDPVKAST